MQSCSTTMQMSQRERDGHTHTHTVGGGKAKVIHVIVGLLFWSSWSFGLLSTLSFQTSCSLIKACWANSLAFVHQRRLGLISKVRLLGCSVMYWRLLNNPNKRDQSPPRDISSVQFSHLQQHKNTERCCFTQTIRPGLSHSAFIWEIRASFTMCVCVILYTCAGEWGKQEVECMIPFQGPNCFS